MAEQKYIVTLETDNGSRVEFFYEEDHSLTLDEAWTMVKRLEGFHPENIGKYNIYSLHRLTIDNIDKELSTYDEEEEGDFPYDDDDLDEIFGETKK